MHAFHATSAADRFVAALCRLVIRRTGLILVVGALVTSFAVFEARTVRIDTRLDRLLPRNNRTAQASREISARVGGSRSFSVLFEGQDTNTLASAVDWVAKRAQGLSGVRFVDYRSPKDFLHRYRYLLLPSAQLDAALERLLRLQSAVSPMTDDLLGPSAAADPGPDRQEEAGIEEAARRYADMGRYHRSRDGRLFGLLVRPERDTTDLGATDALCEALTRLAATASTKFGVRVDVAGSLRNSLEDYRVICSDLRRSGLISGTAILVVLSLAFRSLRPIPILVLPLLAGLTWALALVPRTLGSLNTVTSFLLLAVFGMGIDYSIHLVRRFQAERATEPFEVALHRTLRSSGLAVLVSAATTALAFAALCLSDFRGFSEFGFVVSLAIACVTVAMALLMPAALALGDRLGLLRPSMAARRMPVPAPTPRAAWLMLCLVAVAGIAIWRGPLFDSNFTLVGASSPEYREIRRRHRQVFTSVATPAAIYLANDLPALDAALGVLGHARDRAGSLIGRLRSIRDIAPTPDEFERRRAIVAELQAVARGRWTRHIDDPEKKRWIRDLAEWIPSVSSPPPLAEIPPAWREGLMSLDADPGYVIGVSSALSRKYSRNAKAFTRELSGLPAMPHVLGPAGETAVLAEILWCVARDGPLLAVLTFLGTGVIILLVRWSFRDTAWCLFPLAAGLILVLGVASAVGLRLNYLNVVLLPALIGLGIDHGVHVYFRWCETGRDTHLVQKELWEPLGLCTLTTLLGYSGMAAAHHNGLRSIGLLACLGLTCVWVAAVILLPGMLEFVRRRALSSATDGSGPESGGPRV